jgi:prophage antirepressor-like protein
LIPLVGNEKNAIYINESGFYQLVMRSKMKEAEEFQRWVINDVLPSIRRNGYYVDPNIANEKIKQLQHELAIIGTCAAYDISVEFL